MIKKHVESFAKYAGLATVCFEWLAVLLFYILKPSYFSGQYPISYFAALPETRLVFSVCLTTAAVSFWIFTRYHLRKHYNAPVRLFTLSMIGYAALALTPFDPSDSINHAFHRLLALLFSLSLLAGIYLMGKNNKHLNVHSVSYLTFVLSAIVLLLFIFTPRGSSYLLLLEAISGVICQAWIVWISFHSFTLAKK